MQVGHVNNTHHVQGGLLRMGTTEKSMVLRRQIPLSAQQGISWENRVMTQTLGPWLGYSSTIVVSILIEHLGTTLDRRQFGQTLGKLCKGL